jgi:predicted outer membrane repeat protein
MASTPSLTLRAALIVNLWLWALPLTPAFAGGVVGTGTPTSCTEAALNSALAGGGTITFNCGAAPHTILSSAAKSITLDTTIDGDGTVTLDGQDGDRLFVVSNGAVLTLRNIVLEHGFAGGDGGAIHNGSTGADTPGAVILENSTIRNSIAGQSGGAIVSTGPVTITDSLLENNSALNGGALYPRFAGARTTLVNSTLRYNTAADATNGWGGALLVWDGAAVTIEGGEITSNTARAGGGIYNHAAAQRSTVEMRAGAVVRENQASAGNGGGIYSAGLITITGGLVEGNQAANGGGLYLTYTVSASTAVLTDTVVRHNRAVDGALGWGGGILAAGGTGLTLFGGEVFSNTARRGGGIAAEAGSGVGIFSQAAIRENYASAMSGGGGGGVYHAGQLFLGYSSIAANVARDVGGGIYSAFPGEARLTGAYMSGNRGSLGGGMYYAGFGQLQVIGSLITGNASQGGGGLYLARSTVIRDSTLSQNRSGSGAGVEVAAPNQLMLLSSTLVSNSASIYGGGIYVNLNASAVLENATLSGNRADVQGGGLRSGGTSSLYHVTLNENSAPDGGGLSVAAGRPLTLTNVIVANSTAGGNCGGTVAFDKYSLSSDNTCLLAGTGSHNNADPLLGPLMNHGGPTQVHLPAAESPAVDGVAGNDALLVDQRGVARPQGGGYDIGAVEYAPGLAKVYLPLTTR